MLRSSSRLGGANELSDCCKAPVAEPNYDQLLIATNAEDREDEHANTDGDSHECVLWPHLELSSVSYVPTQLHQVSAILRTDSTLAHEVMDHRSSRHDVLPQL